MGVAWRCIITVRAALVQTPHEGECPHMPDGLNLFQVRYWLELWIQLSPASLDPKR